MPRARPHGPRSVRYGPVSFRAAGSAYGPGTTLVTVSGGVEHPGVYEVATGTALGAVIHQARPTGSVQAVLTGGFAGAWVGAGVLDTPYARDPMAAVGGVVGAGVLVVLTQHACGVTETARVARYMAGESAGQCGPCVFGLPAVADDLHRLAAGVLDPGGMARLEMRVAAVEGRGACRHPDGVARLVRSTLSVFGLTPLATPPDNRVGFAPSPRYSSCRRTGPRRSGRAARDIDHHDQSRGV